MSVKSTIGYEAEKNINIISTILIPLRLFDQNCVVYYSKPLQLRLSGKGFWETIFSIQI